MHYGFCVVGFEREDIIQSLQGLRLIVISYDVFVVSKSDWVFVTPFYHVIDYSEISFGDQMFEDIIFTEKFPILMIIILRTIDIAVGEKSCLDPCLWHERTIEG
jgi:hypothetical protein